MPCCPSSGMPPARFIRTAICLPSSTLGFRGEALPSIASVSRLTLVTREETAESGTEIVLEGGKLLKVLETGSPCGTQVTVKHLFFNTPARQKFLKTIPTEMGHISDVISNMALGWPKIHFKLIHNGSVLQNWSAADDPIGRITDILGKDFRTGLFPINNRKRRRFPFRLDVASPHHASHFPGHFCFCQRPGGPQPDGSACPDAGLRRAPDERAVSAGGSVYNSSLRSGGCQCPSIQAGNPFFPSAAYL